MSVIASDRPNIIFILVDQMRGDALGADGNDSIETPNLDALAAQGTRFCHAYTACPCCIPARATLLTGQCQWHTGILGMGNGQKEIPNDFPHTYASELTAAGYQTQGVGKGHFTPQRAQMGFEAFALDESGRMEVLPEGDDYRRWFNEQTNGQQTPDLHGIDWNSYIGHPWHTDEYLHPTAWTMSRSIEFLKDRDPSRPFMLHISFARPHSPYVPPRSYFDMYHESQMPEPAVGDWAHIHDCPDEPFSPEGWRRKHSARRIHRARSGYYGDISFIDAQIGRLRTWFRRHQPEAFKNTWFIFTSDHGDMQGDHHLWRKTHAYEGSARVPLIVLPPPTHKSSRAVADEPVELRDIMPTILEAAGVAIPKTVDGRSLIPLTQTPAKDWRSYIHGEHPTCSAYSSDQEMQYITNGRWKYIWFPRPNTQQLFDLENDPTECHDLSADPAHQDDLQRWRNCLVAELEARDCGWVKDGRPHCPSDEPLISPWRDVRWQG